MKLRAIAVLLLALLTFPAPRPALAKTGVALIFTANTYGEHSPCPS